RSLGSARDTSPTDVIGFMYRRLRREILNVSEGLVVPKRTSGSALAASRMRRDGHEATCARVWSHMAARRAPRTATSGERSIPAVQGSAGVLAKPAAERHHDVMHGSHQVIVEPDPEVEIAWPEVKRVFDGVSYDRSEVAWAIAARIAAELETCDAFTPLAVEGLTLELFSALLRSTARSGGTASTKPAWLGLVRERIEHDPRVATIGELASIANVHPAYLARRFRQHFAVSVGQYARRARLQWAAQRLSMTDEPVSSIALRAGFADQSHFTRAFRAHFSLTPRKYRLATRVTRSADH
ncbi:MAG: helix-turn-helix transcriptional regulator, partial [Gemmatimonadaceae bacterium]